VTRGRASEVEICVDFGPVEVSQRRRRSRAVCEAEALKEDVREHHASCYICETAEFQNQEAEWEMAMAQYFEAA
jgi:hypothetical protein